jgi:hypothetical protein
MTSTSTPYGTFFQTAVLEVSNTLSRANGAAGLTCRLKATVRARSNYRDLHIKQLYVNDPDGYNLRFHWPAA